MLTLIQRLTPPETTPGMATLALSAEERRRSRRRLTLPDGQTVVLNLPRGTVLREGDCLAAASGERVRVTARPEPVLTVTAATPQELLRAAYHLGNRHVALEVGADYLRLEPDTVLQAMLEQQGLQVAAEVAPFRPEAGAYASSGHAHPPSHPHHHHD